MPSDPRYYSWADTSGQPNYGVGDSYGDVVFSSISATITPVFRWVPGSDPAAPPTMLYAKITSDALAGDGLGMMSCTADNGFGDVTDPNSCSYSWLYPDVASFGVHLEQKDPQGQTLVKLPPQTVSADGGRANDYQNISTEVDYLAEPDNRALAISANVDVTNTKAVLLVAPDAVSVDANGDTNYYPSPNVRGADGTMYGDTLYSYMGHHDGAQDVPVTNWIEFTPTFVGGWHWKAGTNHNGDSNTVPDVVDPDTWKWSPNESEDEWDFGKCFMPEAGNYAIVNGYAKGQDAPAVYNVTYTATDNTDQATATAKYVMTVHDPYEKNFPDHTQDMTDDANEKQLSGYGSQAPFDGSTISASVTTENPWTVKVKANGEIPLPWIGGAIGVDVEKSVTDDDKVGQSVSDNHTHAGDYSYAEAVDHYIYHHGKTSTTTAKWIPGVTVATLEPSPMKFGM